MKKMTVTVLATLSLLLTGCGAGDEEQAKENIQAAVLEEDGLASADVSEEDAECLADGMVDEIGTEKLQEYGLLDDELEVDSQVTDVKMESEDADAAADVFVDCLDAMEMMEEQFESVTSNLNAEQKACVEEALDEDAIRELLASTFSQDEQGMQSLQQEFMACVQPQE